MSKNFKGLEVVQIGKNDVEGMEKPNLADVHRVESLKVNLIKVSQVCYEGPSVTSTKTERLVDECGVIHIERE